jgi:hypothetical protein
MLKPITFTINSSINLYLFTLCSTEAGLKRIKDSKTKFKLITSKTLNKEDYFLLDESCNKLNEKQKEKLKKLNSYLGSNTEYNQNLPFAFYYTIPDNSLPILWMDKETYKNESGNISEWYGLTPRNF